MKLNDNIINEISIFFEEYNNNTKNTKTEIASVPNAFVFNFNHVLVIGFHGVLRNYDEFRANAKKVNIK